MKHTIPLLISSFLFIASVLMLHFSPDSGESPAVTDSESVYELRTYTTHEGKLDALHRRFMDHTLQLFEKHGITNIGYWVPTNPELRENTLIYLLKHDNAEAASASWDAFRADPDWQEAYRESRTDGPIVAQVESVYMTATEYSGIK